MYGPRTAKLGHGSRVARVKAGVFWLALFYVFSWLVNWLSYRVLKGRVLKRRVWDLNICCGTTDGGGVNADIAVHERVPNLILVRDVRRLPFRDKQFGSVLCSHTMEHVEDPEGFYRELQRVGDDITLLTPPLWDITAALNPLDHRWLFLSLKTEHRVLPNFVKVPLSSFFHRYLGQRNLG